MIRSPVAVNERCGFILNEAFEKLTFKFETDIVFTAQIIKR